jgi:hypothetical protein
MLCFITINTARSGTFEAVTVKINDKPSKTEPRDLAWRHWITAGWDISVRYALFVEWLWCRVLIFRLTTVPDSAVVGAVISRHQLLENFFGLLLFSNFTFSTFS